MSHLDSDEGRILSYKGDRMMSSKTSSGAVGFNRFLFSIGVLTVLVLLVFAVLRWLQVPSGDFIDWFIGIASFWWLLVVVTVPWNIHFQAREVLADAAKSIEAGITVKQESIEYARAWSKRSLVIAVALHLVSALGLYSLATAGVSAVGYISAGAALLLTGLRPMVRAYEYLMERLAIIQKGIRYPREDVVKLRHDVQQVSRKVNHIETHIDPKNRASWAAQQQSYAKETRDLLERLRITFDESQITNSTDHARLSREAQQAIAQITADGEFLDHVREIIRFFKNA